MKAITVWQPWAQLLAEGKKHDETRSWRTNYRGEILIHAAKKDPLFGICQMPDEGWEKALLSFGLHEAFNRFERFPTGVIIGKAILRDCKLIDQEYHDFIKELCPEEFLYGDFTVGRYAWRLEEPEIFKNPIPASGKQGLWNFDGSIWIRNGELFIKEAEHGREDGRTN